MPLLSTPYSCCVKRPILLLLKLQNVQKIQLSTVCPRSLDPFYMVTYYIK